MIAPRTAEESDVNTESTVLTEWDPEVDTEIQDICDAAQGSREAFDRLCRKHEATVFAIVFRRVRNRADALEVTQDVFLQVLRTLKQLRDPTKFPGWIRRIAVNFAINRAIRRDRAASNSDESIGWAAETRSASRDTLPIVVAETREKMGALWEAVNCLKDLDRETLVQYYFYGISIEQMAIQAECPTGTIKRRLFTARKRLKKELEKIGFIAEYIL